MNAQVLTVSSKGQISIPIDFRRRLSLKTGDKLVAYATDDVIMLKTIKLPSAEEIKASFDEAQQWASSVGYVIDDVDDIIKSARKEKLK